MASGLALVTVPVIARTDGLPGATNPVTGAGTRLSGASWGGACCIMAGLLLLYAWLNQQRGRRHAITAPAARSEAPGDALARPMAQRALPVSA